METKADTPRFRLREVEEIYDRLAAKYSSPQADRADVRRAAIRYLMDCLNSNPHLTVRHLGNKLLQLLPTTEQKYRSLFSSQIMDKYWEKTFTVMVHRTRYVREELQR